MPFTSTDLVRTHLDSVRLAETQVTNATLILSGTSPEQLPHDGLVDGSVIVKALRSHEPVRESRAFGSGWVILGNAHLVGRSVVVAADSSLGTIYTENTDYIADYSGGRVRRLDSGAIAPAQSVTIWYAHYHAYNEGDDYTVDATRDQIARRSSGAIADGQEVLVDYRVSLGSVSDQVIDQAIAESGEAVLAIINPAYHEEPTPAIVIGATHWAVSQVARMRAAAVLTLNSSAISRTAAQSWLEIAARYDQSGREFLSRFTNPISSRSAIKRG